MGGKNIDSDLLSHRPKSHTTKKVRWADSYRSSNGTFSPSFEDKELKFSNHRRDDQSNSKIADMSGEFQQQAEEGEDYYEQRRMETRRGREDFMKEQVGENQRKPQMSSSVFRPPSLEANTDLEEFAEKDTMVFKTTPEDNPELHGLMAEGLRYSADSKISVKSRGGSANSMSQQQDNRVSLGLVNKSSKNEGNKILGRGPWRTDKQRVDGRVSKPRLRSKFNVTPLPSLLKPALLCKARTEANNMKENSRGWSKRYASIFDIHRDNGVVLQKKSVGVKYRPVSRGDFSRREINSTACLQDKQMVTGETDEETRGRARSDLRIPDLNSTVHLLSKLQEASEEMSRAHTALQEALAEEYPCKMENEVSNVELQVMGQPSSKNVCTVECQTTQRPPSRCISQLGRKQGSDAQSNQMPSSMNSKKNSTAGLPSAQRKSKKPVDPPLFTLRKPSISDLWIASERCPQVCTVGPIILPPPINQEKSKEQKQMEFRESLFRGARRAIAMYDRFRL